MPDKDWVTDMNSALKVTAYIEVLKKEIFNLKEEAAVSATAFAKFNRYQNDRIKELKESLASAINDGYDMAAADYREQLNSGKSITYWYGKPGTKCAGKFHIEETINELNPLYWIKGKQHKVISE